MCAYFKQYLLYIAIQLHLKELYVCHLSLVFPLPRLGTLHTAKWNDLMRGYDSRCPVLMAFNIRMFIEIWVFPKIGVPQNGWFIMENSKMDDLGVPLFSETSICLYIFMNYGLMVSMNGRSWKETAAKHPGLPCHQPACRMNMHTSCHKHWSFFFKQRENRRIKNGLFLLIQRTMK